MSQTSSSSSDSEEAEKSKDFVNSESDFDRKSENDKEPNPRSSEIKLFKIGKLDDNNKSNKSLDKSGKSPNKRESKLYTRGGSFKPEEMASSIILNKQKLEFGNRKSSHSPTKTGKNIFVDK